MEDTAPPDDNELVIPSGAIATLRDLDESWADISIGNQSRSDTSNTSPAQNLPSYDVAEEEPSTSRAVTRPLAITDSHSDIFFEISPEISSLEQAPEQSIPEAYEIRQEQHTPSTGAAASRHYSSTGPSSSGRHTRPEIVDVDRDEPTAQGRQDAVIETTPIEERASSRVTTILEFSTPSLPQTEVRSRPSRWCGCFSCFKKKPLLEVGVTESRSYNEPPPVHALMDMNQVLSLHGAWCCTRGSQMQVRPV